MAAQQAFMTVYAGLVALLALATAVVWRRAQPQALVPAGPLDEVELAALNGGPRLAVITAATELRRSHVTQTPDNTLVAGGPLADGAGELERELFETVRQTPGSVAGALVSNAVESQTVTRMVAALETAGLRLNAHAERRMLAVWLCAVGLAIAGVTGLLGFAAAGGRDGLGLGAIAVLTVAMLAVVRWTGRRRSGPTAAGRRLLESVRAERADELRATDGHLPLAVAMFGALALWSIDPGYAEALGIPAHTQTSIGHADAFELGWMTGCGGGCGGCGGCG